VKNSATVKNPASGQKKKIGLTMVLISNGNDIETKLRSWLRFRYQSETNLHIPELVKIKAKRTLLILHLGKIKAKQILFIPQI
jgi:hypothetical protein